MANSTRKTINFAKIVHNYMRPHIAVFQQITQDINVKNGKLMDVIREKYELSNNTQVGQKLQVLKEYWKVEMAPPGSGQIQRIKLDLQVAKEFFRSGAWKEMTVRQAWLLCLVIVEVGLWFFIGETVGKMSFVGYKVDKFVPDRPAGYRCWGGRGSTS